MIEFRSVFKNFGVASVLSGVSFKIQRGEIVFLLGTSGTGKSVTLKLTVGLLKVTAGEILIDGENVTDYSEEEFFKVRKKCGMVFQQPALFDSLSVFENVAYGLRKNTSLSEVEIRDRVKECLSLVRVAGVEGRLPQEISYGTQKRVSLARTLAIKPDILLFDEPTTGLDPINTNSINRLIQDLSHKLKTTALVVSHDMQCALDIADRILVLDQGELVAEGAPQEIIKHTHPLVQDFMSEVQIA